MKILFRTEAGPLIGAGHAMRCFALAQACRDAEAEVQFLMAKTLPNVASRLSDDGIECVTTSMQPGSPEDAAHTVELAISGGCRWVVLDGYVFGADFQQTLKNANLRVLFIDDYGHAAHYCADVILNQNVYATAGLYPSRDAATRLLLGTGYVLLRREFARWKDWRRPASAQASRLLVSFGGTDPVNATQQVIEALRDLPDAELEVVVVTTRPIDSPRVRVADSVDRMDELMVWADVALTASGTTSWELAYMQTPQIVMPIAENQRQIAMALVECGVAINLGWYADMSADRLVETVRQLRNDMMQRDAMAQAGRALIDGLGASRIAAHMVDPQNSSEQDFS